MKKEVYESTYYLVETTDGTECIPSDVCGPVDNPIMLQDYCRGIIDECGFEFRSGYVGRLTMPGYLDCTEWVHGETEDDVLETLEFLYGDC